MVSRAAEDYLKVIYHLQRGRRPVAPSALAEELGVAPSSVTKMIVRLAKDGLIRRTSHNGVALTARGAAFAVRVIRRHRLWETFLFRHLALPIDHLHDEAERLEHDASDALIDRIAAALGDPRHDPHGHPIPDRRGRLPDEHLSTLADTPVGSEAVVREVPDHDSDVLHYLAESGLLPSARVKVLRREPMTGPLLIEVSGVRQVVSDSVARSIQVTPARRK